MLLPRRSFDWRPLLAEERAERRPVDSRRRLRALRWMFLGVALVVWGRAAQLEVTQGKLARRVAAQPVLKEVELPAPRGRILARDGTLLAYDRQGPALAVQYRWLEEPPNPDWLKQMARRQLPRAERRDPVQLQAAMEAVRSEHAAVQFRLAERSGLSIKEWNARRTQIQARVERITRLVNDRRDEMQAAIVEAAAREEDATEQSQLARWGRYVWHELTHPGATSEEQAPLVVAEALDYHVMADELTLEAARDLAARADLFPGVKVIEQRARYYPQQALAAHAVGHLGPPTAEELQSADEIHPESLLGRMGIEKAYESVLRGRSGLDLQERTRNGRLLSSERVRNPVAGQDVILTLDSRVQRAAEQLLDSALDRAAITRLADSPAFTAGGAVVVLDCRDGGLLALASAPRFEPIHFARGDQAELISLLRAADHPLLDRTIGMALPPGSVMKLVTAAALLEAQVVREEETFYCQGYLEQSHELRCMLYRRQGVGHEDLALPMALAASCNTYFFHYAPQLGGQRLAHWSALFGLGQLTGIELPGEVAGHLPTPASLRREQKKNWEDADSQMTAIGQGTLTATPLQIARATAVIASGGKLLTPRLVLQAGEERAARGTDMLPVPGLSRQTLQALRRGMEQAVSDPAGTAHAALGDLPFPVAAKTGTAETGGDRPDHAWLACYAPADAPRVVVVIALEHAGSGSSAAGPIAQRLLQKLSELDYVPSAGLAEVE